jgi:RNA polymerase sigma factor FliA
MIRRFMIDGVELTQEEVVARLLPLVKHIARRHYAHAPWDVEFNDLVQEGVVGLIDALHRFDTTRGAKFETYAAFRINGAVIDRLRASDIVPRRIREQHRRLQHAEAVLEAKLARTPTHSEVASELGITLDELHRLRTSGQCATVVSLNRTVPSRYAGPQLIDVIKDDGAEDPASHLAREELHRGLRSALQEMSKTDRTVLESYYFTGLSMKAISKMLSVSDSRASQIHTRAIQRLRERLRPIAA